MMKKPIPFFGLKRQYVNLKDELLSATHKVLLSGRLIDGPYNAKLEKWLKQRTKCKYAFCVHSGTQALEMLATACNALYCDFIFKAPTVAIPNITYPATLNAFLNAGFNVELLDTNKNGILADNFDYYRSKRRFMYRCQVGLFGAMPNIDDHDLTEYVTTIVDGAQHWLLVKDGDVDAGMAISFDPTKNLPASGNGGAIVTSNYLIADRVSRYRNNGKPEHTITGTNSKMSELDCAHVLVRAQYIDQWQERRKQIRFYYLDKFKDLPIRCLSRDIEKHSDHKFVIYHSERNHLKAYLENAKIETKIHYAHTLSEYSISKDLLKPDMLSISLMLSRGVLSLPIYPELTDAEVEYIADNVCKYFI